MLTARLRTVQWLSPTGLKQLGYREWGDEDNPRVLLCVHGLTRVSEDFDTLAQALSGTHRVIAADMPGRGRSDWLEQGALYAVPTYVSACVALVARANAEHLDWLGTSMGGLIGMAYASMPGCPIKTLMLNDVGPSLDLAALQRIGQYVGKSPVFLDKASARAAIRSISTPFGPHSEAQWNQLCDSVLVQRDGGWITHYDPKISEAFQTITAETVAASEAMLWAAWDTITAKTLVIRGEHSDLLSKATCQAMQSRGPKAECVEIPGVGHAPTFMQDDQIDIIRRFLA